MKFKIQKFQKQVLCSSTLKILLVMGMIDFIHKQKNKCETFCPCKKAGY